MLVRVYQGGIAKFVDLNAGCLHLFVEGMRRIHSAGFTKGIQGCQIRVFARCQTRCLHLVQQLRQRMRDDRNLSYEPPQRRSRCSAVPGKQTFMAMSG